MADSDCELRMVVSTILREGELKKTLFLQDLYGRPESKEQNTWRPANLHRSGDGCTILDFWHTEAQQLGCPLQTVLGGLVQVCAGTDNRKGQ